MTNAELADEIERRLPSHAFVGAKLGLTDEQWQQIIAALRSREVVRNGVPEQCAQAVIEGINKGLEGEELLAYARRPISAAIEQARALTEQQFSFLDGDPTPEQENARRERARGAVRNEVLEEAAKECMICISRQVATHDQKIRDQTRRDLAAAIRALQQSPARVAEEKDVHSTELRK